MGNTKPITKEELRRLLKDRCQPYCGVDPAQTDQYGQTFMVATVRHTVFGIEIVDVREIYKDPEEGME